MKIIRDITDIVMYIKAHNYLHQHITYYEKVINFN